jgi:hypothetical protein
MKTKDQQREVHEQRWLGAAEGSGRGSGEEVGVVSALLDVTHGDHIRKS